MTSATIGVLVKTFPKLSETFILGELLGLERMGLSLVIYALREPRDEPKHDSLRQLAAPVHYLESQARFGSLARAVLRQPWRYLRAAWFALRRGEAGAFSDLRYAQALAARLRADNVAHLHVHFANQPASVAEVASRLSGIGYSLSAHAKDIYLSAPRALQRKLAAARFTVTCTEHNLHHLRALRSGNEQVQCMYHGIDLARFQPDAAPRRSAPPLILSIGRLREKKGFDTLIQACAQLRDQRVAFVCEIIGYGEQRAQLQALIDRLNLSAQVKLSGAMAHAGVIERLRAATLFALPCQVAADGDRDGIPNVLLEAMAMQLPVVSTLVSGIPEVVQHETNGLLVQAQQPAQLAQAMARLLQDASLRERLGANARQVVAQKFSHQRNLKLVHRLLTRAAQGAASTAPAPDEAQAYV